MKTLNLINNSIRLQNFALVLLFLVILSTQADGKDIVINEIMYHPPNDLDNLQYVELFNCGNTQVDISNWSFSKGIKYTFPAGTTVAPGGYVIVCRDLEAFVNTYVRKIMAFGNFSGRLSHQGETIQLSDSQNKVIDAVKYSDETPWPVGADGYSSSLERICPLVESQRIDNWAASKLPAKMSPKGTPGKQNDNYSVNLPPTIKDVDFSPKCPSPGQAVTVRANISDSDGLTAVTLLYRVAKPGNETVETEMPMKRVSGETYKALIPAQPDRHLVRFRIKAVDSKGAQRIQPSENEPRWTYSYYTYADMERGNIPFGFIIHVKAKNYPTISNIPRDISTDEQRMEPNYQIRRDVGKPGRLLSEGSVAPSSTPFTRGNCAFIYVPADGKEIMVFDYIRINQRKGGFKIRFYKDQTLSGMTTINVIFEDIPRFVLAEPLSYELYRMAGVPAELTEHIRLWIDDKLHGYYLSIEQPNNAFLRRNKRDDTGNLYKFLWYEEGIVRKHEKKTNPLTGHDDIINLINGLNGTNGKEQWEYIQKHFNVEEFINYFAVNMCISNWDGFFNNYFTYHDINGTGKWEIYPWDEDKTWGFHDDASPPYAFYDMPLTFGMNGDKPQRKLGFRLFGGQRGPGMWGEPGTPAWWRPAGYFSGPMLANPYFRRQFLARLKEICLTIFTEEKFFPIIDAMEKRLEPEVRIRAEVLNRNPSQALRTFHEDMQSFRDQVINRRKFILSQPEIQSLGK